MNFAPIILSGFHGREIALAGIKRYVHRIVPTMFYRTNDFLHSRRVLWYLEEAMPDILEVYGADFDVDFARTLALVHDDIEILIGDITLHDKERMGSGEREDLVKQEGEAILGVVKMYNAVANGFDYKELLTAAKEKKRLEAQFVSFFDKFDAAGEAWHEIWAGNHYFLFIVGGKPGQEGGLVRRLNEFPIKYPAMAKFFERHPQYLPQPFDFRSAMEQGRPHTEASLQKDSGYPPYESWKRIIMKREGLDFLITQVESR